MALYRFMLLLLLPFLATAAAVHKLEGSMECVYTLFVRTSKFPRAGTHSVVNVTLYDESGTGLAITNLVEWGGLMGANWDYFHKGNLDIFSGRGPCLNSVPCKLTLGMDGSGSHPGWYCNYVEVTSTGPHLGCAQQKFTVETWLGPDVINPKLIYTVDLCKNNDDDDGGLSRSVSASASVL